MHANYLFGAASFRVNGVWSGFYYPEFLRGYDMVFQLNAYGMSDRHGHGICVRD